VFDEMAGKKPLSLLGNLPANVSQAHGEMRAYPPNEIFQGRLSWKLLRKPIRTADGRTS
jgi:hypothetical protein